MTQEKALSWKEMAAVAGLALFAWIFYVAVVVLVPSYCRPERMEHGKWVPDRWGSVAGPGTRTSCGPPWDYFGAIDGEWQGGYRDLFRK